MVNENQSNNRLDGHLGHLAIAEQLEETNDYLNRIATALERAIEIYINQHALPAETWETVQKENHRD